MRLIILFLALLFIQLNLYADTEKELLSIKANTFQITFTKSKFFTENRIEIPFEIKESLVLIEAEVDSMKGKFILDSGAPHLILNTNYFSGEKTDRKVGGITGTNTSLELYDMTYFSWKATKIKNVKVEAINLSHIESSKQAKILGLLGFDIFKDFEIVLDYKSQMLTLYKLGKKGIRLEEYSAGQKPTHTFDLRIMNKVILLKASINEKTLTFSIDTGAENNVLDNHLSKKVFTNFKVVHRAVLQGTGNKNVEVLVGYLKELNLGELAYENMRTVLSSLQHMSSSYGVKIHGMLGYQFLNKYKTGFNFKQKKMYIWLDSVKTVKK